jgi:hypothetical protein
MIRAAIAVLAVGCSVTCYEPWGKQRVLMFSAPLETLADGGQIEVTIPQHYSTSDKICTCPVYDFDFDNTTIEVTGQGSLTVVTAERIPTTDLSWKAGGYRIVMECHLPSGASSANDMISVRVLRDGQELYADTYVQECRRQ